MAMQLNIKDPVLIEGARALAKRRGTPVTATLRALVEKELASDDAKKFERLALMKAIMDSIYDDTERDGFAR